MLLPKMDFYYKDVWFCILQIYFLHHFCFHMISSGLICIFTLNLNVSYQILTKNPSCMFYSFKVSIQHVYFFIYGWFLNLRSAGCGVPPVEFSWAHPEVTHTPGGPLRPGWPLSPGRPVCPLWPCLPGWPLKALPGRPRWPAMESKILFSLQFVQSAQWAE